jgi:hypothetical protein
MAARQYSSIAVDTTITAGINAAVTSCVVAAATGFPSAPFTMVLDYGTASQEIVEVTVVGGTTLTITRGVDGSTAAVHAINAPISHKASARDYRESQVHIYASAAVHGLAGTVVGTSDSQTLTNKTLTAPVIADHTNATHTHFSNAQGGSTLNVSSLQVSSVAVPTISSSDTLSNKTLASPVVSGTLTGGTVNPTTLQQGGVQAVTTTGSQTLTNKTISDAVATATAAGTVALQATAGNAVPTQPVLNVRDSAATSRMKVEYNGGAWRTVTDGLQVSANRATFDKAATIATGADATKGLIVKANSATQAANLQEWQDQTGAAQSWIGPEGAYHPRIPAVHAEATANVVTAGTTPLTLVTAAAVNGNGATSLKVSFSLWSQTASVVADAFEYKLVDSVAGTIHTVRYRAIDTVAGTGVSGFCVVLPTAVVHTYSLTVTRVSGTGTLTVSAGVTAPITIAVEPFFD